MQQHNIYDNLLHGNKIWVDRMKGEDPAFFKRLSMGQNPHILWIGCADSRVAANQITNTKPGSIFVHRNIANMVVHSDMNMLSVLDYAVNVLKIKHVIVCGHYGCGGVLAAMSNKQFGLIDNWLRHIKDVYRLHREELDSILDNEVRVNRFVELNIMEQVLNLSKTSIIQNSWQQNETLEIHGWVYDVANGVIRDLNVTMKNNSQMQDIYRFDNQSSQIK